jgi:hypothetical protein
VSRRRSRILRSRDHPKGVQQTKVLLATSDHSGWEIWLNIIIAQAQAEAGGFDWSREVKSQGVQDWAKDGTGRKGAGISEMLTDFRKLIWDSHWIMVPDIKEHLSSFIARSCGQRPRCKEPCLSVLP